jgi:hypothetical protein
MPHHQNFLKAGEMDAKLENLVVVILFISCFTEIMLWMVIKWPIHQITKQPGPMRCGIVTVVTSLNKKVRFGVQHLKGSYNMKKFILIIFLLNLSGCKWFTQASPSFYAMTDYAVPEGTPAFQQGFKDGCSAASYSRGNTLYKHLNSFKYDTALIGNTEYVFGQKRGYSWCFQQAQSTTSGPNGSWDRAIEPHGYDPTFSSGDIGTAWDGMFGGSGGSLGGAIGGDVGGFMGTLNGSGSGIMSGNPIWAGGSKGQIFGQ